MFLLEGNVERAFMRASKHEQFWIKVLNNLAFLKF
jgi:hypothetical protein